MKEFMKQVMESEVVKMTTFMVVYMSIAVGGTTLLGLGLSKIPYWKDVA